MQPFTQWNRKAGAHVNVMGKRSRTKGRRFEQNTARALRPLYPNAKRGLAQTRFGAGEAPDVDGCPPWWIECKHGKKPNLRAALSQAMTAMAEAGREQDQWPIAVCKDDRKEPIVVMRWADFLELVTEWKRTSPVGRSPNGSTNDAMDTGMHPGSPCQPNDRNTPRGASAEGAKRTASKSDD